MANYDPNYVDYRSLERTITGRKKPNLDLTKPKYKIKPSHRTSLRCSAKTKNDLIQLRRFGESYFDVIYRLIEYDIFLNGKR